MAAQHPVTDVHAVEREIEAEKDKQEKAVEAEDFEAALNYKTRIAELEKKIENHTEDMKVTASVNDVAESVERMTGIPGVTNGSVRHRTSERYGSSFADESYWSR